MRLHLALEEGLDRLGERDALGVAQLGIRLQLPLTVEAGGRFGIALGERREDGLLDRGWDLDTPAFERICEQLTRRRRAR